MGPMLARRSRLPWTGSKRFYISLDDQQYNNSSNIISKNAGSDDPCLMLAKTIDETFILDGYKYGIYEAEGQECQHSWPACGMSYIAYNPTGGCTNNLIEFEDLPFETHTKFDSVTLIEQVSESDIFGANAKQVVLALRWYQSFYEPEVDFRAKEPIRASIHQGFKYYHDRLKINGNLKSYTDRIHYAECSNKIWLQPQKLASAWKNAQIAAYKSKNRHAFNWLAYLAPHIAGLMVRPHISNSDFLTIYKGFDDVMPVRELNKKIEPWRHSDNLH